MAEDMGERTEQPTARRLSDARSRGQVAKSQDLAAAIELVVAALLVAALGAWSAGVLASMLRQGLEPDLLGAAIEASGAVSALTAELVRGAWAAGPIAGVLFAAAFAAQAVQVGLVVSARPLAPNPGRLNPVAGFKRLLSKRSLVRTGLNAAKLGVLAAVVVLVVRADLPALAALPALSLPAGLAVVGRMVAELLAWLLAMLLALGVADFTFQRWQHRRDLRMTRQEVKDERRSMEGDPEIKGRRLRLAQEIAMQRIGQAVPRADVVITNPTHFAVALEYDQETMRAPRVTAKGADLMAWRVRQVAAAAGVPIVERPPLARGLYHGVDVGREIPAEFYAAVAEVLAYVYRLEGRAA